MVTEVEHTDTTTAMELSYGSGGTVSAPLAKAIIFSLDDESTTTFDDYGVWRFTKWTLNADPNKSDPYTVGVYRTDGDGPSTNIQFSNFYSTPRVYCFGNGVLRVHEVALDIPGNINRIVADFDVTCDDSGDRYQGSIRFTK